VPTELSYKRCNDLTGEVSRERAGENSTCLGHAVGQFLIAPQLVEVFSVAQINLSAG
jgi:hypothetical protein